MYSRTRIFSLIGICSAIAVAAGVAPQMASAQSNTTFSDLVGVNAPRGVGTNGDLDEVIGNARADLRWQRIEPSEGDFKASRVREWGDTHVGRHGFRGITSLPSFSYGALWAADYSSDTFDYDGNSYTVTNTGDRTVRFKGGGINRLIDSNTERVKLQIHPDHVADWKDYVQSSTSILVDEYDVEYFQIWNEPSPQSSFYWGDMDLSASESDSQDDGYYFRVHKPASEAIRAAGGKVVYGGWPLSEPLGRYDDWLDYHNAWGTVDAVAMHYRPVHNMDFMRRQAANAGFPDMGIWQTEMGNTSNTNYLPSFYPRFAYWAITHNDGDPDRYRAYYFPYAGGTGEQLLISFNEPTENGIAMKTMGELLGGGELNLYDGVSNEEGIGFNANGRGDVGNDPSSMEAFKINDRIVVAMHLADVANTSDEKTMTFTFELLDLEDVLFADRVTPWGKRIDVMDTLEDLGVNGISFAVPTDDIELPEGGHSTSNNFYPRTFFVEVGVVPEPGTVALLGLGVGGLLLSRRRRERRGER